MPTLAQLRSEPYWDREVVTVELDWLGDELCRRTGRPRVAFGSKGNAAHLRGAHRSQEWILNSQYCTSRTYTVQPGLTAAQLRHVAGADFTPGDWGTVKNRQLMVEQTNRLVSNLKAGRLPGVREVIGTLNGRTVIGTRADGSTFGSDDSHLEHWHLTLDRRRCADRSVMERIVAVALGEDDDMTPEESTKLKWVDARLEAIGTGLDDIADGRPGAGQDVWIVREMKEQGATLAHLGEYIKVVAGSVDELKNRPTPVVTDEQLERVLRKVLGSVDGAAPQA